MLDSEVEYVESWGFMLEHLLVNVAPDIQRNLVTNKPLRKGFANFFLNAAIALRANTAPSIANLLDAWRDSSEWPPVTRNFYERGGSTDSVLRVIFEGARDQDEWAGDGYHMLVFKEDIADLPKCRNNHEFGFVALRCGVVDL